MGADLEHGGRVMRHSYPCCGCSQHRTPDEEDNLNFPTSPAFSTWCRRHAHPWAASEAELATISRGVAPGGVDGEVSWQQEECHELQGRINVYDVSGGNRRGRLLGGLEGATILRLLIYNLGV